MGASIEAERIGQSLARATVGFGVVGAAAPDRFLALYRIRGDDATRVFVRLWGLANLVVGAHGLRIDGAAQRRQHLVTTAALSAGNTAVILAAGREVSWGSRVLGVLTTGGFTAAALYALSQEG